MHTRHRDLPQHPLFRRLIVFALGLLIAFTANAATWRVNPWKTTPTGYAGSNGVNTRNVFETFRSGTASDGTPIYSTRNFPVSTSTLGNLAKGVLKRGNQAATAYMVIKTIVDAAGWSIDELKKQVVDGPPAPTQVPPGGSYWVDTVQGKYFSTAAAAARFMSQTYTSHPNFGGLTNCTDTASDGSYSCSAKLCNATACILAGVAHRINNTTAPRPVYDIQPSEVPSTTLGDLVARNPNAAQAVLLDQNGRPIMTPELTKALNDLRKQLEQMSGDPTTPDVPVNPDYANAEPQPDSDSTIPEFCDWAATLCDWLKWTKEEPQHVDEEVPEEELDLDVSWNSGLGEGACPPPATTTIMTPVEYTIEFSYQPLCDLAGLLKPLLIACAAIVAAFIIGGSKHA